MSFKLPKLFSSFKNPTNVFVGLGVAVLFFDLNYYFMANLPGTAEGMCVSGGNLTLENVSFAVLMSIMVGIMVAGMRELVKSRSKIVGVGSLSSAAALVGSMTIFCTVCTFPFLSLLGLSVGFNFLSSYSLGFKLLSLGLMAYSMYILNKRLMEGCTRCKS